MPELDSHEVVVQALVDQLPDPVAARTTLGAELDEISRDLDATTDAWVTAGYGYGTPEDEAREAVFARLRAWNARAAGGAR